MNFGDQITREFIKSTYCPNHGEFCSTVGGMKEHFCRERLNKAKKLWHKKKLEEKHETS